MPYKVPGRTVADLSFETALRLAQVPGIVGIKDASGNIERASWLIRGAPAGFSIYSGDDGTAVALMLLGGHGSISVTMDSLANSGTNSSFIRCGSGHTALSLITPYCTPPP